jgi:hypothetical protein
VSGLKTGRARLALHNFSMRVRSWAGSGMQRLALLATLSGACGGGAAAAPAPKPKPQPKPAAQTAAPVQPPAPPPVGVPPPAPAPETAPGAAASSATAPDAAAAGALPDKAGWDGKLPPVIDGQDIPRPVLLAVLARGVGRFLQHVELEPSLERGRFVGWRLLRVFDAAQTGPAGLRPGDLVLRVNGQSIERPEQFKNVWDSLATESLLILQVERGGQRSEIRHKILQ